MKLQARYFGIAGAITFSAAYTIFALCLKFFPDATLRLIGTIHMIPRLDYIKSFVIVTPLSIVIGMVSHIVFIFLFFWVMAKIYNAFQKD
jgi:2TM family of unknown function (DUF5676)